MRVDAGLIGCRAFAGFRNGGAPLRKSSFQFPGDPFCSLSLIHLERVGVQMRHFHTTRSENEATARCRGSPREDSLAKGGRSFSQVVTSELTCSGWVRSPYCSTRRPSRGSGRALGSVPLETGSPRRCSGTQPGCGRIPVSQRREKVGGGQKVSHRSFKPLPSTLQLLPDVFVILSCLVCVIKI